ncbi:HAD-IA family hydrolase [archaeon]|nr:HAD-IA family hydrolase [archaeon]
MKLITFDMDNTLLNSDKVHVVAFNKSLKKLGLKQKGFYEIAKHFGKPKEWVSKVLVGSNNKKLNSELIKWHDYYLLKDTKKYSKKIPGALSVLKKLKKEGYRLALLSNCRHRNIKLLVKSAGLDSKLFDLFIGNDDVKHPKPWPDEILLAEKLLKHKPDFHVGDSIYDVKSAKRAKVKSVAVSSGHYTKSQLKKEKPWKLIDNLKDILELI